MIIEDFEKDKNEKRKNDKKKFTMQAKFVAEKLLINNEEKQSSSSMLNSFLTNANTELEFKLGTRENDEFVSHLSPHVYKYIYKKMESVFIPKHTKSLTVSLSNYRKTIEGNQVMFMKKKNIESLTFSKFPVKLSLSSEENLTEAQVPSQILKDLNAKKNAMIRQRNRYTFTFEYYVIDFSTVSQMLKNKTEIRYEIEVEFKRTNFTLGQMFEPLKYLLYMHNNMNKINLDYLTRKYNSILVPDQKNPKLMYENKPVNLTRQVIPSLKNYALTNKLNGVRYFMIILEDGIFLFNRKEFFQVADRIENKKLIGTITDGELFEKKYWIFDVMSFKGKNITSLSLLERVSQKHKIILMKELRDTITFKQYFLNERLFDALVDCQLYMKKFSPIDNDGIIFQPIREPYKNSKTFKYKPPEKLTIDFKVVPYQKNRSNEFSLLVQKNDKLEVFRGTRDHPFSGNVVLEQQDIQRFQLYKEGTFPIIEFAYSYSKQTFYPILERKDKVAPNYITVAESVWNDIMNPITQEQLYELLKRSNATGEKNIVLKYRLELDELLIKLVAKYAGKTILDVGTFNMPYSSSRNNFVFNIFNKKIPSKTIQTKNVHVMSEMNQVQSHKYNSVYMLNTLSFYSHEDSIKFLENIIPTIEYDGYLIVTGIRNVHPNINNDLFCFFRENPNMYELQLYDQTREFTSNRNYFIHDKELVSFLKDNSCQLVKHSNFTRDVKYSNIFTPSENEYFKLFDYWVFVKRQFKQIKMLTAGDTRLFDLSFTKLKIVRTGTLADGSCFIHSILTSLMPNYTDMSSDEKKKLAIKFRKGLANLLTFEIWQTLGQGQVAKNMFNILIPCLFQQFFKKKNIESELSTIFTSPEYAKLNVTESKTILYNTFSPLTNDKKLLDKVLDLAVTECFKQYRKTLEDCSTWIGQEHIEFISNILRKNLYFINGNTRKPYFNYSNPNFEDSIVILWVTESHYESIGKLIKDRGQVYVQRIFKNSDSLIQDLQKNA